MTPTIKPTTTQTRDPLFGTKSVPLAVSHSKVLTDAQRITLSLTQETAAQLATTLTALAGNERGIKLDIHIGKKTTMDGTRTFDSAFFFAKPIQAFGTEVAAGDAPKKFIPKTLNTKTNG